MNIGFIGCGSMAKAMIGGILKKEICKKEEIIASTRTEESGKKAGEEFGITMTMDNQLVVNQSDLVVLGVKPQQYEKIIREIRDQVKDQVIVSIAPGKTLEWIKQQFGKEVKLVRCMPNTPALVGEGMTGVCHNEYIKEKEFQQVISVLNSFGKTQEVPEHLMDVVVGVSGSSPAYVFMIIEAMADAAVAEGMPRNQAYEFSAQALLGSAKMVLDTKTHPGKLKDMVCSPGGTTIQAVKVLEEKGLRSAMIEAVTACIEKSRNMK